MNNTSTFIRFGFWSILVLVILSACESTTTEKPISHTFASLDSASYVADTSTVDLTEIKERGKLRAILTYSSSSYFIYRGMPMGYEYELITRLADHLDLELEIVVAPNMDHMASMLYRGEGDIIAHGWTVTKNRKNHLAFTQAHNNTRQVLVQRLPENWRRMKLHQIEKGIIRNPLDLIGQTVSVRKKSSYFERIHNLSEEMGGDINVEIVPGNWTTDEIIQKVSEGEISYTIADHNIARINKTYYNNLDVETAVSFPQRLAWAVRKTSPELLDAVNDWISGMQKETDYYVIYNKYFKNERAFRKRLRSEYFSKNGDKISEYDPSIKSSADELEWDWRLLASLIYQESQFDPKTQSWAGAQGLMQVMPATARDYGITNLFDPEENIKAGTSFLEYLGKNWSEIPDSLERVKFILASYNAGPGHVADARRLAEKFGKDPNLWDEHVDEYLLKKASPEFFNDPVCKYGYCRGKEPYNYVREILDRYNHYQKFITL